MKYQALKILVLMTVKELWVTYRPVNKTLVQPRPPHGLLETIRSLLLHLPDLKLCEAETYSYPESQVDHAPDQTQE